MLVSDSCMLIYCYLLLLCQHGIFFLYLKRGLVNVSSGLVAVIPVTERFLQSTCQSAPEHRVENMQIV